MVKRRMKKYRRVLTGVSVSLSGLGGSSTLVQTDQSHLDNLVNLIDNKGVFYDDLDIEKSAYLVDSVKEVRTLATATESLVESVEAYEIASNIADACRVFMRDFDQTMDTCVWKGVLQALRVQVVRYVSLATLIYGVPAPKNLDVQPHDDYVEQKYEEWRNQS